MLLGREICCLQSGMHLITRFFLVVIKTELFNVLQINLFIILYFYFSLFSDISTKAIGLNFKTSKFWPRTKAEANTPKLEIEL